MLCSLIFIYFIIVIQIFAEDMPSISQEVLTDAIEQATKLQEEASKAIKENLVNNSFAYNFFENSHVQKNCSSQGLKGKDNTSKGCNPKIIPPSPQRASIQGIPAQKNNADQILIFVSFSMPEASLKSLFQEASMHNAVLIMRGLYEDSFVKTASKLQELSNAVDIHPELFETHHVTSVPTFVRLENGEPIFSLKGNVTLDFVLKTFEDQKVEEAP